MFGRFNRFSTRGSKGNAFESASCCASYSWILLAIGTVLAVSIFVCLDLLGIIDGLLVSVLVCLIIVGILLRVRSAKIRPGLSAA